ncbi:CDP-diacylglycerol--glycerol-3-phosphate 3-phosphatidyltransferase [Methylorubrum extorquens]|uniref:CDP-diacylglycerol--glycerol-3-phosphate 3-phosphatidyltransferase n=7 Tax=Methylorubrum extorquens TaxID=408 RepID=C5AVZ4_METEA|nr:CDP-diacylglycerol--glycerol-3-phosphate 3-phosphatidyltransferase [Methylorubrum extorquens PA1]ACS40830.1 phosphatidylglycerophosphate synthetase [Methylorubrum extorquens AM1]APX86652.1 CDP-diacylglycerol--glycerol-3-phosphate 3-phosphatidyltransferase [Methylorubrum extorquens]ARO56536.1 CDP-diacylglycerol--glycerol-3-phosphate 3-phosphatidyltransferase [Methylorubrum zatmanii]KQO90101.1 CDP-diacylglycerol--glycerol-3-phosphate 3-phosphatidyltransferase [Methylobacterium sp. Leaf90]KQO9
MPMLEPSPVPREPAPDAATPRLTPPAARDFTPAMNAVLPRRRSQAWTLANCLTYGRLVAVPVVVVLLFWPDEFAARWTAFGVFVAAAITDYLDGYVARAWAQSSALGRMLDPIADKLLVAALLLMLAADRTIAGMSLWAAIVILCREVLVSGLREYLAELKVGLPVSRIAKWKTTVQLIALGFLVAGPAGEAVLPGSLTAGIVLLWLAAALTLYTGWDYMRAGIRHVIDDPR